MEPVGSRPAAGGKRGPGAPQRSDVQALLALLALDEGVKEREAAIAQAVAVAEQATSERARMESEARAAREDLRQRERAGENGAEIEGLRRGLVDAEQQVTRLMRLAETKRAEADTAAAALKDACSDLVARRRSITSRLPGEALNVYEDALRHGLVPAAIATRGAVCWGCFHRLSPATVAPFVGERAFVCCPHCERLLFNPDWAEHR